jgi:hypothetical protein
MRRAGASLAAHHFCGFGEPDVGRALFSAKASSSYLYQGEMRKDTYLFLPFHVPQAMADATASKLTIRGTVVFDPPVNADDAVNYSLCRVAGKLRKRVPDGLRDVVIGGDEDDLLLPWNPLLHFTHTFKKGYAAGEWELRLRLMTRGDLPDGFGQTLAVVIEVLDENGGSCRPNASRSHWVERLLPCDISRLLQRHARRLQGAAVGMSVSCFTQSTSKQRVPVMHSGPAVVRGYWLVLPDRCFHRAWIVRPGQFHGPCRAGEHQRRR